MPETELKPTFTTGQVAKIMGVSSRTVIKLIDVDRQLEAFTLPSGMRRISRSSLIAYFEKSGYKDGLEKIGEL